MERIKIANMIEELRWKLNLLGITPKNFSEKYFVEITDGDPSESDVKMFYEKFKKQLSRAGCTSKTSKQLSDYIYFLKSTKEYKQECQKHDVTSLKQITMDKPLLELTGGIEDYPIIINKAQHPLTAKVLQVAAAYALAIGSAWDFHTICVNKGSEGCRDARYLVLWEGDVGHFGGSGSWGTNMCEVAQGAGESFYVDIEQKQFDTNLRMVTKVNGFKNGILRLTGYRHKEGDSNNFPSLKYQVMMKKNDSGEWHVIDEALLSSVRSWG